MNGPIAQAVSLCLFGNAYLQFNETPFDNYLDNSVFQFCDSVKFIEFKRNFFGRINKKIYAENSVDWFTKHKKEGIKGYLLSRLSQNENGVSDYRLADFIGGYDDWYIIAVYDRDTYQYWLPKWEVWNQNEPNRKMWQVKYELVDIDKVVVNFRDIIKISEVFANCLRNASDFAYKNKLSSFGKCFDKALSTIETEGLYLYGYHYDLVPGCFLNNKINYLLDACQSSWVFGGMGSWNDLIFEKDDQKIYEDITNKLFDAVSRTIVACVNYTFIDYSKLIK